MNIQMWPDDSPPDLSRELDAAESEVVRLEAIIHKLVCEKEKLQERVADRNSAIEHLQSAMELKNETHQKIVLAYMQERDEAREAARWLYSMAEDRESANAQSRWTWLKEDAP